jgi:ribosomal protein S18 acetylase RimI-like enzyme
MTKKKKEKEKKKHKKKHPPVEKPSRQPRTDANLELIPKVKKNRPKSRKNVIIRDMVLEDLSAVYALGERIFTVDWPTLYRTWDEYEIVELFASDGDFCLVADRKGKVVGFVLGTLITKRRSAWSYGYLLWIGVAPEMRGLGIGEWLVEQLTGRFIEHGARMMLLDTGVDNQPARRMFEKLGFSGESEHIYLFRNLTTHPDYLQRKEEQRRQTARTRPKKLLAAVTSAPKPGRVDLPADLG